MHAASASGAVPAWIQPRRRGLMMPSKVRESFAFRISAEVALRAPSSVGAVSCTGV